MKAPNIEILYEDKDVVVINKPAGISVHKDGKNDDYTIADWFAETYPKSKKVGEPLMIDRTGGGREPIARPGIVHRLDKETSGALILAKNQTAFDLIKEQFQEHSIEKVYRAFVYGNVKDPKASLASGGMGIINASIGRSPNDVRMWTCGRGARDPLRDAITKYKVLQKFTDLDEDAIDPELHNKHKKAKGGGSEIAIEKSNHQFTYMELYPKTGRTHQLRVHLRYLNHPIVSDSLYAGAKEKKLGMKRLALHAYSISFVLPSGAPIKIGAPLPKDFQKVVKDYHLVK